MFNKKRNNSKISMKKIFSRNKEIQNFQGPINMNTKQGLTNEKMYDPMIIAKGSQGQNVIKLQNNLNQLSTKYQNIPILKVDGIFGPKTEEAVLEFQGLFNLTTDGVVGRYTWTAINEALSGKIYPKDDDNQS